MKDDVIYRQAAIDAISAVFPVDPMKSEYAQGIACGAALAKTYVEQLPSAEPTISKMEKVGDTISRQAAKDIIKNHKSDFSTEKDYRTARASVNEVPSAQSESCEYYALCRHGRDENKLRVRLGFCEYCNEDSNGYVKPIEKNNHAFVRFGTNGWELSLKANGWHGSAKIRFCPMCGRELYVK